MIEKISLFMEGVTPLAWIAIAVTLLLLVAFVELVLRFSSLKGSIKKSPSRRPLSKRPRSPIPEEYKNNSNLYHWYFSDFKDNWFVLVKGVKQKSERALFWENFNNKKFPINEELEDPSSEIKESTNPKIKNKDSEIPNPKQGTKE